jgi:hypothetical protein
MVNLGSISDRHANRPSHAEFFLYAGAHTVDTAQIAVAVTEMRSRMMSQSRSL